MPANKKIILIASTNINEKSKGFTYFKKALKDLKLSDYYFLFLGKSNKEVLDDLQINYKDLGFLKDNTSLRLAYSAADVFLAPYLQEAFGKTIAEAMACGTPVVAFGGSGPDDIIQHKKNGYLAKLHNSKDLAEGIKWVLEDKTKYRNLSEKAVERIKESFSIDTIAKKYINFYKSILSKK